MSRLLPASPQKLYTRPSQPESSSPAEQPDGRPGSAQGEREQWVLAHLPQVRLVARSVWQRTRFAVELDDLIGYGMLGLLDAVRKFDPARGVMLKSYAEHRIRGAILDGLRGMDWLSRSARKSAKAGLAGSLDTGMEAGPQPSAAPPGDGKSQGAPARRIPPQPAALICGGGVSEIERLYQNSRPAADWRQQQTTPEQLFERAQERSALARAIERLPARQRQVLDLYYHRELSMKQIAGLMGVHESRISQIHLAAITRLRKSLHHTSGAAPCEIFAVRPEPAAMAG